MKIDIPAALQQTIQRDQIELLQQIEEHEARQRENRQDLADITTASESNAVTEFALGAFFLVVMLLILGALAGFVVWIWRAALS
jgi:hypothetical protein